MTRREDKKARVKDQPLVGKNPKAVANYSYSKLNPSWRISKLCLRDPYGWQSLPIEKIQYIQQKLLHLESMTWDEILVKNGHHHEVDITRLCRQAQDYLEEMSLDDIDQVLSLRLTGKERVWGILNNGVVELLWWDPNHEICSSKLKHT